MRRTAGAASDELMMGLPVTAAFRVGGGVPPIGAGNGVDLVPTD